MHDIHRLQVKFHAHLNSMEESMNATKKEKVDVESLTRQLETGRTKTTLELQASKLSSCQYLNVTLLDVRSRSVGRCGHCFRSSDQTQYYY